MNFESIDNMPRSQKIILIVLLFAIIIGGFVYFIFLPGKAQVDVLSKSVSDLNHEIMINEVKLRRLDQLKMENAQLQAQLNALRAQLPAEAEVSGLLKQISDLSIESGLSVKLWKPGARKKDPSGLYTEIPVDVEVSGGYHALGSFFDKVSKLPRIVNITGLNMDSAKVSGRTVFIQDKFVATTFAAEEK
ncbi:MAG: type 4a pilus biogenesis protein PilO [Nitrospirae bacterium]|nr:type 4a pilus biogenesis protein PilO [Nitrospirota bacterium]